MDIEKVISELVEAGPPNKGFGPVIIDDLHAAEKKLKIIEDGVHAASGEAFTTEDLAAMKRSLLRLLGLVESCVMECDRRSDDY